MYAGGSRNSGYIQKLIAMKEVDMNRILNPSQYLINNHRKIQEQEMRELKMKEMEREHEIKNLERMYMETIFTLGSRLNPSKARSAKAINEQYFKLTGKYLPSFQQVHKEDVKQLKKWKEEERNNSKAEDKVVSYTPTLKKGYMKSPLIYD